MENKKEMEFSLFKMGSNFKEIMPMDWKINKEP